jgi:DNA-binding response OmpR family regulator
MSKPKILYVEDDPDYRDALRMFLEAHGYEMVEASSAEEGFKVYQREQPDFIIVDLMMEEVDAGATLVTELKAAGNTAPVYMLSSVGDTMAQTINAAELGLAGIFQKPIDNESLLHVLETKLA